MRKYIKKPVMISAVQWTGNNTQEIADFIGIDLNINPYFYDSISNVLHISTLEGNIEASIGDFIIKGIKGEFYPCKPDIFELSYTEFTEKCIIQVDIPNKFTTTNLKF